MHYVGLVLCHKFIVLVVLVVKCFWIPGKVYSSRQPAVNLVTSGKSFCTTCCCKNTAVVAIKIVRTRSVVAVSTGQISCCIFGSMGSH